MEADIDAHAAAPSRRRAPGVSLLRRRILSPRMLMGIASIATVLVIYSLVAEFAVKNPVLMPSLADIGRALKQGFSDGTLLAAIWASVRRVLIGFSIGGAAATLLGALMGWFRAIDYLLDPIIEAMRPVPPLAYIPLVIIWVGIGDMARILVITLSSFLICIVSVYTGMKSVPRVYVEAARTLGASNLRVFRTVAVPSAIPFIFGGLRVALGAAWMTLVAAELVAAQNGLGYILETAQRFFRTDVVLAAVVLIGALAYVMDRLLQRLQRYFLRWADV